MDGILNIYKEKGFTSHDVVAVVRKTLHMKKVGHTGTLDPDAEGVLPICVGKGTKLADIIMDGRKSYRAVLHLGVTTTTEDATGDILVEKPVAFEEEKITQVIKTFVGGLDQIPPMYSAVKIGGKKLYELARAGKEVERMARRITVYDIRILKFMPPCQVEIEVDCSKGTYIRTLCADIGKALGCGGHMASLLRTKAGAFALENAIKLDALKALTDEGQAESVLLKLEAALAEYPRVMVSEESQSLLYNGGRIRQKFFYIETMPEVGQMVTVFDHEKKLVGLYHIMQEEESFFIKPFKMLI